MRSCGPAGTLERTSGDLGTVVGSTTPKWWNSTEPTRDCGRNVTLVHKVHCDAAGISVTLSSSSCKNKFRVLLHCWDVPRSQASFAFLSGAAFDRARTKGPHTWAGGRSREPVLGSLLTQVIEEPQ